MALAKVNVNRNDVDFSFEPTEVKRGAEKGSIFLGPSEITETTLPNVVKWVGVKEVCQYLGAFLRQRAKGWSDEAEEESATKKDGDKVVEVDEKKYSDVFSQMAKDFSARGESIPDLKDEIEELTNEFTSLDYAKSESMARAKEIAESIKAKQIAIASKRRQPREKKAEAATK